MEENYSYKLTDLQLYDWIQNLPVHQREFYINKFYPKWNPDNWGQLLVSQIRKMHRYSEGVPVGIN